LSVLIGKFLQSK